VVHGFGGASRGGHFGEPPLDAAAELLADAHENLFDRVASAAEPAGDHCGGFVALVMGLEYRCIAGGQALDAEAKGIVALLETVQGFFGREAQQIDGLPRDGVPGSPAQVASGGSCRSPGGTRYSKRP
jgi:hypothetical protein